MSVRLVACYKEICNDIFLQAERSFVHDNNDLDINKINPTFWLRFGLKLGIAAGAIYYTVEQGVWKDSTSTEQIYKNVRELISPYVTQISSQAPIKITEIPTPRVAVNQAPAYWNRAVNKSCIFIWHLPDTVYNKLIALYNQVVTNSDIAKLTSFSSTNEEKNK